VLKRENTVYYYYCNFIIFPGATEEEGTIMGWAPSKKPKEKGKQR